jgi:hypothetical protein
MTILDPDKPKHAAADGRLKSEPMIWLTTVTPSGQPQSTPVWFLWQDSIYQGVSAGDRAVSRFGHAIWSHSGRS